METIQGIYFEIFKMKYCIWNIWNPELDIQHYPAFVSVIILTKNVEVYTKVYGVSCKWIRGKHARGANRELGKGEYKDIS